MTVQIKKISVIGAGTMGRGIAQVFALFDYTVNLVDKKSETLEKALLKIKDHTEPESRSKLNSITATTDLSKIKDCDFVIEAAFENIKVKKEILKTINNICSKDTIIATNTSSFPITDLASALGNPSRFIGMHFMNPPKVMKLIEIVKGKKTSDATVKTIIKLTESLKKIPAIVNDSPGFVSNRLLFALIGESLKLLEEGIANKEDIDTVMKHGMHHPMGPIELADFIGLDICQNIMSFLYKSLGDDRFKPTAKLESLVNEGKLGKKSGEGFYYYQKS